MIVSRRYDVYYSWLDRLILGCVRPVLAQHRARLTHAYWERHFAGGLHIRVQLRGEAEDVDAAAAELLAAIREFIDAQPSPDMPAYSPERAALLLQHEGMPPKGALEYRNNVIVDASDAPFLPESLSPDAVTLFHDFQHDAMPLVELILEDPRPRREVMLRLFFLQALVVGGDLRRGSVSWRSHWEGVAASWRSERLIERVRGTYEAQRDHVRTVMLDVLAIHEARAWDRDPVLLAWRTLVVAYRESIRRTLKQGRQLTRQPADAESARTFRTTAEARLRRDSAFMRTLCSDEVFLTSIQHAHPMLVARVLVNLLYAVVAAVGLTPLDKFLLCHCAYRSVEEHFQCDLITFLEHNMDTVKSYAGSASPHA
jgi:hypothetical protein